MADRVLMPVQLSGRELEILERLSAGLSDQQIAAELFLSPNTVRWYNRQIYSKLGVGSRTQAIRAANDLGLLGDAATASPLPTPALPVQNTSFIGRSREVAEVKRLLRGARLLTLTGVGGTGKTRLALRVASEALNDFADGVCFVDLAPVGDPELVVKAIAASLGVVENPQEALANTLKRALRERQMLLLIDNFEPTNQGDGHQPRGATAFRRAGISGSAAVAATCGDGFCARGCGIGGRGSVCAAGADDAAALCARH
jgi:DNA-binding CsgD family transcriptional regulator